MKNKQCNLINKEIHSLKEEISHWQNLSILNEEKDIRTEEWTRAKGRKGNCYSDKIREVVYTCLAFNVAQNNVSDVIHDTVKIYTGHDLTKLQLIICRRRLKSY